MLPKIILTFHCLNNCSSDLKNFANSRPSASSFSRSLEQFFLTVGQNNFGNKIPLSFEIEIAPNLYNKLPLTFLIRPF